VLDLGFMRVMLTGGGTGGHIFPLLAVVEELRLIDSSCLFHWFGSKRMEAQIVPEAGINGTFLGFTFSYRRLSAASISYYLRILPAWLLGIPFWTALSAIIRFKPDVILTSGGYVSAPMLMAARACRIPIGLIEINGVPGRVTTAYASKAARIYCATNGIAAQLSGLSETKKLVTGFPVIKPALSPADARIHFGLPQDIPILVVQGGSSGASPVNNAIYSLLGDGAFASRHGNGLAILHQRGTSAVNAVLSNEQAWPYYRAIGFDKHLSSVYFAASLYFGRSGASTIGELIAAKLPAILMPYTMHADKQQYFNADILTSVGSAEVIEEKDSAVEDRLRVIIEECIFGARGANMREGYMQLSSCGAIIVADDLVAQFGQGKGR
jgi:UDP-N-acetylglucosamine--N-acetylmuramyl-(pentapeptide) pyrophosphoryl-undecaprenol N-acetylglucosamine transferase